MVHTVKDQDNRYQSAPLHGEVLGTGFQVAVALTARRNIIKLNYNKQTMC